MIPKSDGEDCAGIDDRGRGGGDLLSLLMPRRSMYQTAKSDEGDHSPALKPPRNKCTVCTVHAACTVCRLLLLHRPHCSHFSLFFHHNVMSTARSDVDGSTANYHFAPSQVARQYYETMTSPVYCPGFGPADAVEGMKFQLHSNPKGLVWPEWEQHVHDLL